MHLPRVFEEGFDVNLLLCPEFTSLSLFNDLQSFYILYLPTFGGMPVLKPVFRKSRPRALALPQR